MAKLRIGRVWVWQWSVALSAIFEGEKRGDNQSTSEKVAITEHSFIHDHLESIGNEVTQ